MSFLSRTHIPVIAAAWFLGTSLFLTVTGVKAQEQEGKNVTVSSREVQGRYEVFVENKNPYDITLTLKVSGSNFRTSQKTPYQRVYGPDSRRLALQIFIIDKSKSYKVQTNYTWFMGDIHARHNDSYVYRLPYRRGEAYKLGQSFEGTFSHSGNAKYALDFMMPEGTPVLAAREGTVVRTHDQSDRGGPSKKYADDSNYVIIRHDDGTLGEYAHLQKNGVLVEPGRKVRKGEEIGLSGNTGFSSGPHLHFMVTKVMEDGSSQSLPIRFRAGRGVVTDPREGELYKAL